MKPTESNNDMENTETHPSNGETTPVGVVSTGLFAEWWDKNKLSPMWTGAWHGAAWDELPDEEKTEIQRLFNSANDQGEAQPPA